MASEDKRLKNRLAQRKYRTNMKKRLEDLEKLAAAAGHPQPPGQSDTGPTKQPSSTILPGDESQDDQSTAQMSLSTDATSPSQPSSGIVSVASTGEFIRRPSDVDSTYGTNDGNMFQTLEQMVSLPPNLGGETLGGNMNGRDMVSPEHQTLSCNSLGSVGAYSLSDVADFGLPTPGFGAAKTWGNLTTSKRQHSFHSEVGLDHITGGGKDASTPTLVTHDWQRDRSDNSFSSLNLQQPFQSRLQATLEQRFEYVLKCAHDAGFDDLDSMFSCYYTEHFVDGTAVSIAQEKSRSRALPGLLEGFRKATKSWNPWEANAYKDALMRSAERIIAEEFERLEKKIYTSEIEMMNRMSLQRQLHNGSDIEARSHREELHSLATEIEANLKNELPNLCSFIMGLTKRKTSMPRETQAGLILATMKMLARPGDDLTAEASNWTRLRATSDTIPDRRGARG